MSETVIVNKLVEAILGKGYSISLDAEGEEFLDNCRDKDIILRNVDAADMVTIRVDETDTWFLIIWGNEDDIISDYSDNPLANELYAEVARATGI